ncbi:hypothetical protein ACIBF5_21030 [Micromonospora sp. NPDC050417]|uniref:hypothetical protein n=1 Tax=Micromonospora sp. NPDC050417 TaxID=3364280 RepID=UPI0037A743AE
MVEESPCGAELPDLDTLAGKLEYLFDNIRPTAEELGVNDEPGRRYTIREIANKINQAAETDPDAPTISAAYIGEMRRGVSTDPRASHILALARAFGVDPGFLIDRRAARNVQEQIDLLNELRQLDVRQVALRWVLRQQGLSADTSELIERIVERCRQLEGLDRIETPRSTSATVDPLPG